MNEKDTRDLLRLAKERYSDAQEKDADNREAGLDDLYFSAGQQWPEAVRAEREASGRPILTINRMPQFVRQVTGDIRRSNPAIDIIPADGDASEEMAEIFSGLIRNIEYQSDGSSVYERAAESAAMCGIGNFRVLYGETPRGNEIRIESIYNPFSVTWDPMAKDPTRKDARFCFIHDRIPVEDFKEQYPDATTEDFDEPVENSAEWFGEDTVLVSEYFWKEDGKVKWALLSGHDVLEGPTEWPGEYIPVIATVGEEMHIGDKVVRTSVIRHAKDAQRLYNYWRSAQTEVIALQPKAPYKVTPKQIEGHETYWQNANSANYPYLPYNVDPQSPGAPQREAPPMASPAMMQEVAIASDDMKATTGIYDAALGEQGNEKSGVAIKQRQMESDVSTSIYVDNNSKSIAQCGRIIVGLIPLVYDTTRIVRIIGEDGATALQELNTPVSTPYGPMWMNDPSFGVYDVRIKTGPSYSTQRQEAVDALIGFVQAVPQAGAIAGDLIARNMDWPGADELADRLKKMLPPGIAEVDDPTPEEQQAMQARAQEAQKQAAIQEALAKAEVEKKTAEAAESNADAQKAQMEAQQLQMEMAVQSGQMNAAIAQIVQQEVARAVQALMQPRRTPLPGPRAPF